MKKQRNRRSIALSDIGIEAARQKLACRNLYGGGWTYDGWALEACVSTSTVKRLLAGKSIDPSCFYSLLKKLDLELKDGYIRNKTDFATATPPILPVSEYSSSPELPGVLMIGKFTPNKIPRIERALKQLQSLLVDGEITFNHEKGMVTVHGEFSEQNKEIIEETIAHLEKLFDYSKVTW
jgi:hypothetical protein